MEAALIILLVIFGLDFLLHIALAVCKVAAYILDVFVNGK